MICLTDPRKGNDSGGQSDFTGQGGPALVSAGCDKQRQALLKWHEYNHKRATSGQNVPNAKELLNPGHQDDGDSNWGVIREGRDKYVPHWSAKQLASKKSHHCTDIHETTGARENKDRQTTTQAHFQHPRMQRKPGTEPSGIAIGNAAESTNTSHVHNSHAHLSLAKRRHACRIEHEETDFRSIHPPAPSHSSHFFASPEPQHMAAHLYPEGPSQTARHVPEHFVNNVVHDNHPYDRSARGATSQRSSRASGIHVWDGVRQVPATSLHCTRDARSPRMTASPSITGVNKQGWSRDLPSQSPDACWSDACQPHEHYNTSGTMRAHLPSQTRDGFDHYNTSGRPPAALNRAPEIGHVYKSHAEMAYDKRLCQAAAYKHSDRWERIEQGSNGHSVGGSDFGSVAGSQSQAAGKSGGRDPGRSRDPGRRDMRSKSTDAIQRPRRQSPRAASSERPRRQSPGRTGSQTQRRQR